MKLSMDAGRKCLPILFATALILGGCGENPEKAAKPPQSQQHSDTSTCKSGGQWPATPTVEQLTNMMQRALDQSVPLSEKVTYVQGADGDPELLNRIAKEARESNFDAKILSVSDKCNGTATAATLATFSGKTNAQQVPLVAEGDKWKLNKEWMCGLMKDYQLTSPICT